MLYLLPQAVDRAAARAPEHEAVRFAGAHLTYGDLAIGSERLARVLVEHGVARGDRVAIYMGKGLRSAIAIHGIMKAGAAYVPLDPAAPPARLAFILRDAGIRHIVTEPARATVLAGLVQDGVPLGCAVGLEPDGPAPDGGWPLQVISWGDVDTAPAQPAAPRVIEQDLAYILYTSGSTGTPKGVMHTHRSALAWAGIAADTYGLRADDRLSNHAPLHFDLSTLDYFSAAIAGATTVIIPEAHVRLPASLARLIESERMTVLYTVPFALVQLLLHGALEKRDLAGLRWVLFGGEPMPTGHLRTLMRLLPHARFCNVYGPTETNGCTHYVVGSIPDDSEEPIPIGRPYGNVEAMLVDDEDHPVQPGETGHLLIRSPTMMRGYWGRPDLDAKAFFRRSVFGHHEDVFHRTGDLARELPDGNLGFLGRKDRQIKTRGYRVELDEVEAVLAAHAAVEMAAVFAVPDGGGSQRIEAAVVARLGMPLTDADLNRHAAGHLPAYAVPERIALMTGLPRTSTDKIDRLRLQALAAERNGVKPS
jgi:amino acid adenylation domain-containing protein